MKKLIAFISSVAIVLSFSLSSFAATATTTYDNDPESLDYGTFTTIVTGAVGNQATILAFEDDELYINGTDNNIQFIDQKDSGDGTTTFKYKLMDDVVAGKQYTIMVGGSDLGSAVPASLVYDENDKLVPFIPVPLDEDEDSTYTISGTVTDVSYSVGSEEYDLLWATKVTLTESPFAEEFIEGFDEIVLEAPEPETSQIVSYSFADVIPGSYFVNIFRYGYLPRCIPVTVGTSNVNLDTNFLPTFLYGGDLEVDGRVIGDDFDALINAFDSSMGDGRYSEICDLVPDGRVIGDDFDTLINGFDKSVASYLGAENLF